MIIGLIKVNNIIIIIKIVILVMVNHYRYNNNFYDNKIRELQCSVVLRSW